MTVQFAQVATDLTPNHKMANGLDTFESRPVDQFWEERWKRGGRGGGGQSNVQRQAMEFCKERNIMKKMMRIDLGEEKKKPCPMQFESMTAFIFKIANAFVKNTKLILKTSTRCSVLVFASNKSHHF